MNPAMNSQAVGSQTVGAGTPGRGLQQPNNFTPNQQPRSNPQPGQVKMTAEDNEAINRLAQRLAATTTLEDRRKIQQNLQNMPADQLQNMKARGVDPIAAYFRERATREWRRQQPTLGGNNNFTPNVQMYTATPAPRQGQAPTNMAGTPASRPMPAPGQPGGTPFTNNIDHFQGLQADGLRSQEQGQLVVPASNGQGINPDQFRLEQLVNNQQLAKQNPGGRANAQFVPHQTIPGHQQQGQGVQQVQQDKKNTAALVQAQAQAQAQARARAEAAARAQQQQQPGIQNQPRLQGM